MGDVANGLDYLHSLNVSHGGVKAVSCIPGSPDLTHRVVFRPPQCGVEISSWVVGCVIVLIAWQQANVVVNKMGRAQLTDYGLAPIISGPSFTMIATPVAVGNSRWLAPEIIAPSRKRNMSPVMESKAGDVFAFAMFTMEVFTGKIPFEGLRNEAVVLHILGGGRPEVPANAQDLGLTGEMWRLLQRSWHQDPKKRPIMKEVVKIWHRLAKDNAITRYVQTTLQLEPFFSFLFQLFSNVQSGSHCNRARASVDSRRRSRTLNFERGLRLPSDARCLRSPCSKYYLHDPVSSPPFQENVDRQYSYMASIAPSRRRNFFCGPL